MVGDPGIRRLALRTVLGVFHGAAPPDSVRRLVDDGLAGFTLFAHNIVDREELPRLIGSLRAQRRDLLIAVDEEGGDVTRLAHATGSPYPGNATLGVVDNPTLTRRIYRAIGAELAAAGFNLNLAPTVDVNTAGNDGVIGTRSFGANPALVAAHAAAAVVGLQEAKVAACAKHFPGHGATRDDSHLGLPTVDEPLSVLRTRDFPPFAAAIGVGVKAVMTAHIRVPELTGADPATFSRAATGLPRAEYGFDGVMITDALEMAGAAATAGGVGAAAVRALAAGADLLCFGGEVDPELVEAVVAEIAAAVRQGELPAARLEQAAARTAALAAWTLDGSGIADPEPPDLGYQAAKRALQVEGAMDGLAGALLVQLESGFSIAEGRVPWGLLPHLADGAVDLVDAALISSEQLRQRAGDRPVVLVGRHVHSSPAARALIEKLAADHPCAVVEMGWPAAWRPSGVEAFVTTHGASYAHGAALAELLGLDRVSQLTPAPPPRTAPPV